MRRMFQVFLVLFGGVAIAISLAHLAIGPDAIVGVGVVGSYVLAAKRVAEPADRSTEMSASG